MFDGYEKVEIKNIFDQKKGIKNEFILEFSKKIKSEEMEAQKEDNVDIIIDLYGCEGMFFTLFEDKFYEAKLYNIYTKNNHFLH